MHKQEWLTHLLTYHTRLKFQLCHSYIDFSWCKPLDYILAWSSESIDVTLISILKMNSFPNIGGLSNKVAVAGVNSENKFKSSPKVSEKYFSIFFYLRNSHLHKHDVKSPQNTGQCMSSFFQYFIFNNCSLNTLLTKTCQYWVFSAWSPFIKYEY